MHHTVDWDSDDLVMDMGTVLVSVLVIVSIGDSIDGDRYFIFIKFINLLKKEK